MRFNYRKMKKDDLIWLNEHVCKHRMPYTQHPNCFFKECPEGIQYHEKTGFLDIETTGFYADYDFMLSWCILDNDSGIVYKDLIEPEEIKKTYTFDKRICESLANELVKYDRIIVYNGQDYRFDIPFARTRAVKWGIDFPGYKDLFVEDIYCIVKSKLRLSRKKLGNVCGLFEIPAKSLPGDPNIWMRAAAGNEEALEYVLEHNIEDVWSLKGLYDKLYNFYLHGKRSI